MAPCLPVRLLLDECMPRKLKRDLVGHDVLTVPEAGWAGITNGELPASLARLPRLEKLDLGWNKLARRPEWLADLEQRGCRVLL